MMKERRVSIILFYDEQRRILLQGRRDVSKFGEEWGFFGGSIEQGETPEQALIREVREELRYDLSEFEFFQEYETLIKENIHAIAYVHLARFPGFSHLDQQEGVNMKLFSIEDALKLKLVNMDYKILRDVQTYLE